jgi:excisionase family DNA binding protein
MGREIHFIGYTEEKVVLLFKRLILDCAQEFRALQNSNEERKLTMNQACKYTGVSIPTLRKYVKSGYIRRHDLGPRKKFFYLSELNDDLRGFR